MTNIKKIISGSVPEPRPNIFSNCLKVGDQIFMSGMTAGDNKGGVLGDGSPEDQSRQCLNKIKALVERAGGRLSNVVKLTVYLTNINHRSDFGKVRKEYFKGVMPCSTLIEVNRFVHPNLVIEVDAIAMLNS
jgi:enamine deaminase RidA (YjgF/YER057c/UK114 family)